MYVHFIVNGALINVLQICDLGSARHLEYTQKQTTAVGTYAWMAPEVSTTYVHDLSQTIARMDPSLTLKQWAVKVELIS